PISELYVAKPMEGFKIPRLNDSSNATNRSRSYNPFGPVLLPPLIKSRQFVTAAKRQALEKLLPKDTPPPPLSPTPKLHNRLNVLKVIEKPIKKTYATVKPPSLMSIDPNFIKHGYKFS
ncbi:unnamed protein product, partial [Allacma fusca]